MFSCNKFVAFGPVFHLPVLYALFMTFIYEYIMVYNLRSSQRKGEKLSQNCFLRESSYGSIELLKPRVRLERLKILENPESSTRFCVKNGKIRPTHGEKLPRGNGSWKSFFISFFFILLLFYWRGDIKKYGSVLIKNRVPLRKVFPNLYVSALKLLQYENHVKNEKINVKSTKINFSEEKDKTENVIDVSEFRELIRSQYKEIKKRAKNWENLSPANFIREQCKKNTKSWLGNTFDNAEDNIFDPDTARIFNETDYALESNGAKVVSVFNTEPYGVVNVKLWGYDFGSVQNYFIEKYLNSKGPSSVITPWKKPGDCWAFKGSRGKIEIELSDEVIITAIGIDHIAENLSLNGKINSAPRRFSVVGIEKSDDESPSRTYLGTFEYKIPGSAVQTFLINPRVENLFERIVVLFETNHGNQDYTCVYKIKVHGHKRPNF